MSTYVMEKKGVSPLQNRIQKVPDKFLLYLFLFKIIFYKDLTTCFTLQTKEVPVETLHKGELLWEKILMWKKTHIRLTLDYFARILKFNVYVYIARYTLKLNIQYLIQDLHMNAGMYKKKKKKNHLNVLKAHALKILDFK